MQSFPGGNPIENAIGKRFRTRPDGEPWQIVGVARDGKYLTIGEAPRTFVWFPLGSQLAYNILVVRTTARPETLISAIRNEFRTMDPNLPVTNAKTLTEHMNFSLFPARAVAWLLASFGTLALTLAAIGIYGVMSYSVAQRTREVGIRMALGAQRSQVLKMMLTQGMKLAAIGMVIGLAAAFALTRLLANLLYGVSSTDAVAFVGVSLLLGIVVLLACFIPASKAAKVDPMIALRYE